jgi:hypothetical protein
MWEDYIKMNRTEIKCEAVEWIRLALNTDQWQARLNVAIYVRLPQNLDNILIDEPLASEMLVNP